MKQYKHRIADKMLQRRLLGVGAVLIEGPKWCGKTTTASQHSNTILYLDDPSEMSQYLRMIIERRRRKDKESIDCSRSMMTSMGHLANEIRKIGRNYNQFVAAYNRAVKLTGKDGYPVVSERETRRNQLALMELTLEMTHALHSMMDHMGIEHGEIQIVKQQPKEKTEEKKSHHRGELIIP